MNLRIAGHWGFSRSAESLTAGQRWALVAAVLAVVSTELPVFLVGTLAVQLRESLNFGTAALGEAVSASFVAGAVLSMPAARLVERVGSLRVIRLSCGANTATLLAMSLLVASPVGIFLSLIGAGAIASALQPATNQLIFESIPVKSQGAAFGIKQSAIPFAMLLAGLAVPGIALTIGWRYAFGCAAAVALLSMLIVPNTQVVARRLPPALESSRSAPMTSLTLVSLAAGFALALAASSALTTFAVTAGVHVGLAKGTAGLVAALASALGLLVRLAVGRRADSRSSGHFRMVAFLMCAGAVGYAALAISMLIRVPVIFVAAAVVAFGAGWGWNGLFNYAIVQANPQSPAWATGVTQAGGQLGAMAGPLIFGLIASSSSYSVAWVCGAVSASVGGLIIFVTSRSRLRTPEATLWRRTTASRRAVRKKSVTVETRDAS